jgi:hypothetical protein
MAQFALPFLQNRASLAERFDNSRNALLELPAHFVRGDDRASIELPAVSRFGSFQNVSARNVLVSCR